MSDAPAPTLATRRRRFPLYARALAGVGIGALLGVLFGKAPWLGPYGNEDLGPLGMLVVRLLKALATPLIVLAVLDSFLRTRITARIGWTFLGICLVDIAVAMIIGLTLLNVFHPGTAWAGRLDDMAARVATPDSAAPKAAPGTSPRLDPLKNLEGYVPESVVKPLLENSVISLVLLAILLGAALRHVRAARPDLAAGVAAIARVVEVLYATLSTMLLWVAEAVPFAVMAIVAQVVGRSGLEVFTVLWVFLLTMLAGLVLHGLVYYPLAAWLVGRKTPREYLGTGADAVVTGLSCNSSLATVPVTLSCLRRMGVSEPSARMSACIGTNLNNDGIVLYEAMATLFLCQAMGWHLGAGQQMTVVLASVMAGVGIAGIPDAGLIVLPLVLTAAGLPEAAVAAALPLIIPVDWIIARARSAVNVLSDMLVAILLDRLAPPSAFDADSSEAA